MSCKCTLNHCCQDLCNSPCVYIKDYENHSNGLVGVYGYDMNDESEFTFCPYCGMSWMK